MKIPQINIDDFDYLLPSERIAKYPLENRDQSKLLVFKNREIADNLFINLPDNLPENSLLVFNNTKVIRARLNFRKSTGAKIEIFCLEPTQPNNAELAFQQTQKVEWHCLVGNQKKWKEGLVYHQVVIDNNKITVAAEIIKKLSDGVIIRFEWNGNLPFATVMEAMGQTPIPPYLNREAEDIDTERYQTIYSKHDGSVAAPTAGLHFTPDVFNKLTSKGLKTIELTLHVGAGTFKPVKSQTIDEHEMHTERFHVPVHTINALMNHKGPVIAVGTTTVRTLESLYLAGVKLKEKVPSNHISQWDGFRFNSSLTFQESLDYILKHLNDNELNAFEASTSIIIIPGYRFKVIRGLVTNFHQPRSTLLLLISALVGDDWQRIYQYALDHDFRFLSYGDSSLLLSDSLL